MTITESLEAYAEKHGLEEKAKLEAALIFIYQNGLNKKFTDFIDELDAGMERLKAFAEFNSH